MIITFDYCDIEKIVSKFIIPLFSTKNIFLLYGPMGTGKTTIVKEILKQAGITETIISPTFGYVNIYQSQDRNTFYHFDLYRISSLDEFISAGFDEFFSVQNSKHFIEWPETLEPLLQNEFYKKIVQKITLSHAPESPKKRNIIIEI